MLSNPAFNILAESARVIHTSVVSINPRVQYVNDTLNSMIFRASEVVGLDCAQHCQRITRIQPRIFCYQCLEGNAGRTPGFSAGIHIHRSDEDQEPALHVLGRQGKCRLVRSNCSWCRTRSSRLTPMSWKLSVDRMLLVHMTSGQAALGTELAATTTIRVTYWISKMACLFQYNAKKNSRVNGSLSGNSSRFSYHCKHAMASGSMWDTSGICRQKSPKGKYFFRHML